jgi:hypothetical protein
MYHKFILFYIAISQFDWPITRKNSENYFGSFMYKDVLPPLWFRYIHVKVRTLGKSLWYKIQDFSHVIKVHMLGVVGVINMWKTFLILEGHNFHIT